MSMVDKRRLTDALKLIGKKPKVFEFAWGQCLEDQSVLLKFGINGVGDISVPVSLMDIKRIKNASNVSTDAVNTESTHILQLDASSLISFDSANFLQNGVSSLASTARHHLGINPGVIATEAHLEKLLLVPPGGCIAPFCVKEREPGMFASMILQIPVENGHTGGNLTVQFDNSSLNFDCEKESSSKFHLSAIYNGCQQELKTVTNGWIVMLSFNLVWRNAMTMADSPLPLPSLLATLNEIVESLRSWTALTAYEPACRSIGASSGTSPEEIIASVLDTSLPSDRLDYSPALLSASARYANETSNMLFFLLEGKYSIADLSFSDLTGQDQLLARLFNCSQFLDIHLAVITQHVTGVPDYCDLEEGDGISRTFKIEHWINASNVLIKLKGIEFDYRTQLIGNTQKLRNYVNLEEGEKDKLLPGQPKSFTCHHPVLVIWPKSQTIRIYCQYGFNAVLDRMEATVDISSNHHQELIGDLGIVLSFCRAEPLKVWRDPLTKAGQRTFRLLRLCLFLRAREEGLELLELLGTNFNLDREDKARDLMTNNSSYYAFEGIRSEQVARVIAEFQHLICDWSTCCDRILALVTPIRIADQLTCLVSLVKHLMDRSCIEGAVKLMDSISSTMVKLEDNIVSNLRQPELDAFVDQLITMEANLKTSQPQRIADLKILFPKLDFYQQCRIVVDLQKEYFQRLQDVPLCMEMFLSFCRVLSLSDLHTPGLTGSVAVQLLKCYLTLGDENLVQSLADNICSPSEPSTENKDVLDTVLSSPEIWELVSKFQLAKKTMVHLVTTRISSIISLMDQPLPVMAEEVNAQRYEPVRHSWMMQPRQEALRASLSVCIHQVFRLEREQAFVHGKRNETLSALYCKLSLEQLCHLVLDLQKLDGSLLKDNPASSQLFVELCQLLVNRSKDAMPQVPHEIIIEVVKTFFWLGDVLLVRALVKQICLAGSGGSWDPSDKNKLLETILSSPGSWGDMAPSSNRLVRDSSTALIGAWIVGLCRILDQVGPSATLDKKTDGLRSKIATCVNIFIRTEKSQPRTDQPSIATFFTLLLSKLSVERLCHLILDLRNLDATSSGSSLLILPACCSVYRDLCRLLVTKDLNPVIKSYGWLVTEVWKCVHWLGDGGIFINMSHKILDAFLPSQENPVVAKIVVSSELRAMARESTYGREAFCLFLDQRIDRLKAMAKPFLSWDHPYAVVPGHPEVESFLRSSHKTMVYSHFATFASACKFAIRMGGTKNGYSVRVNPAKVGKQFRCKIEKMLSRNALLKKEVDELAEFHLILKKVDCPELSQSNSKSECKGDIVITLKREVVTSEEEEEVCVIRPTKRTREEPTLPFNVIDY